MLCPAVRIMGMSMPLRSTRCKVAFEWIFLFAIIASPSPTRADWQRDDTSIAWQADGRIVWQFSFDPAKGKPFFHPLRVGGSPTLTNFKPEDHPWHYGLWFSWKYINHANYWEEDRATGKAEGATRWAPPDIATKPDGSATIRMQLSYVSPSNVVDLTESREIRISAPATNGSYTIDWRAHFVAGTNGALLDRTPMPGEPDGRVNGGYAGLSLRMAGFPLATGYISSTGPVNEFREDRARPAAPAVALNFMCAPKPASLAILSDPANAGENPPWYMIRSETMRFVCAAILAPGPRQLKPGETMDLNYRILLRSEFIWAPEILQSAQAEWLRVGR